MKTKNQNITKKMAVNVSIIRKKVALICLTLFLLGKLGAQDIMTLRNGDVINIQTLSVSDEEVKYLLSNNLDGPLHKISVSEVFAIKYGNGTKTVFTPVQPINTTTVQATTHPLSYGNEISVEQQKKFEKDSSDFAKIKEKRFGGPRVGLTYIGQGTVATYLSTLNKYPMFTQFGWQFEKRLFTIEGGMSGLAEFIPMIGGIEQGLIVPNASLLIGLRSGGKRTFEFALGPNFSVVADYKGRNDLSTGLVIGAGMNFQKGNINFPVNIAFIPSVGSTHPQVDQYGNAVKDANGKEISQKYQSGFKISLIVGFNYRKK